ncbi:MAG: molybdenum cofactor biosynthesis protein MoaE [Acidimicrobiia bacterium]|jgi:molybdopterin synthase catalytic subunit
MLGVVVTPPRVGDDWIGLTHEPLPAETASVWATTARSGGVVCFLGVVRDHAEGRDGVTALTYEAYEEKAVERLEAIAAETRRRWPDVERLVLLHRLGDVPLSEASVLVVAATPHRAEAFEAARFAIDTLKEAVPIWKLEHHSGGTEWSAAAAPVRGVHTMDRSQGLAPREPKLV